MSIGKGLLFSCLLIMYVAFMISKATPVTLKHSMRKLHDWSSTCSLRKAEEVYIKFMFPIGGLPAEYYSNSSDLVLEGITFGNATEIENQTSICAIHDYLNYHLPTILNNLHKYPDSILKETKAFLSQFTIAVKNSEEGKNVLEDCNRNVTTSDDYSMKRLGLRIISYTRRWLEQYTGIKVTCLGLKD
ncbi:hypothetical protein PBY51_004034 [Eleginops maclovinus]|uniref:Uncharacterized protein n=1 Tax=Eleginops maclovinus TaxID=56733 RepID=A0AAN8ASZ5_ELEMC|nr:hypothetical protein PBY51_004034 [Eleginops maclovinus]